MLITRLISSLMANQSTLWQAVGTALPSAHTVTVTRGWVSSTECCCCSVLVPGCWVGIRQIIHHHTNDYVRKHKAFSRKVSSSAQRFPFGLEAVLILLLKAGENLQPSEAWLISLLKCLALSNLKYVFPVVNSNKWWFVAFIVRCVFSSGLKPFTWELHEKSGFHGAGWKGAACILVLLGVALC